MGFSSYLQLEVTLIFLFRVCEFARERVGSCAEHLNVTHDVL